VVGLFYDREQKARQDLMIVSPSTLIPLAKNADSEALAQESPLMDVSVIKYLL
jgi:hypothetical protein